MKPRQNLYIDADLSAELDRLAKKPGASKSAIVAEAMKTLFERRGAKELDDKLKPRLDKLSNQLNRIERNQRVLIESLALYIRFHFSVLPPLPEADQAAGRALANDRFQAFIDQVGRRVAGGKSVVDDVFARAESETQQ
jgi:predicted transcriptional regulator